MKLSLIISTFNRPDTLELVLKSIALQKTLPILLPTEIEVLIADDGSLKNTKELINTFKNDFPFKLIHVWHEDKGFRLAAIRNLAVSVSTGNYIVFIDGDCIVRENFLMNQYILSEKNYFVRGNRVLLSEKYTRQILMNKDISVTKSNIIASFYLKLTNKINKLFPYLNIKLNSKWRKKNNMNWRKPKGCNMAIWRDNLMYVNGFDESFKGWGHEDADFIIRLLNSGVKIKSGRFTVPVYHLWHKINDRSNEQINLKRLLVGINDKSLIRAKLGIDQYQ